MDAEGELGLQGGKGDVDLAGLRVACDVGQGFLGDSEKVGFEFAVKAVGRAGVIVDSDAGALGELFSEPPKAGVEAEVVQDDRAEELGEFADVGDGFVDEMQVVGAQSFRI